MPAFRWHWPVVAVEGTELSRVGIAAEEAEQFAATGLEGELLGGNAGEAVGHVVLELLADQGATDFVGPGVERIGAGLQRSFHQLVIVFHHGRLRGVAHRYNLRW